MIRNPITMHPEQKIYQALKIMERYRISGVPITKNGKLVGILTNRDLRFETRLDADFAVMTKENLITVPVGTTLEASKEILHRNRIEKLLVVDDDFNLHGLITIKDIRNDEQVPECLQGSDGEVAGGCGHRDRREARTELLLRAGVDLLVIDTAHGHSGVISGGRIRRERFPDIPLIAGNIATAEAAVDLISAGRWP